MPQQYKSVYQRCDVIKCHKEWKYNIRLSQSKIAYFCIEHYHEYINMTKYDNKKINAFNYKKVLSKIEFTDNELW